MNNYYENIFKRVMNTDPEFEPIINEVQKRLDKYSDSITAAVNSTETDREDLFYILLTKVFNYALNVSGNDNNFSDIVTNSISDLYNIIVVEKRIFQNYSAMVKSIVKNNQVSSITTEDNIENYCLVYGNNFDNILLSEYLNDAINTLSDRERMIIRERMNGDTLASIAKEINLSADRVRQIEAHALRKLRHPRNSRKLIDYRICLY